MYAWMSLSLPRIGMTQFAKSGGCGNGGCTSRANNGDTYMHTYITRSSTAGSNSIAVSSDQQSAAQGSSASNVN